MQLSYFGPEARLRGTVTVCPSLHCPLRTGVGLGNLKMPLGPGLGHPGAGGPPRPGASGPTSLAPLPAAAAAGRRPRARQGCCMDPMRHDHGPGQARTRRESGLSAAVGNLA
jgi:hypothetical protein